MGAQNNRFTVTYGGPSFVDGSFDLIMLRKQLSAINGLIDEAIKTKGLDVKDVKKRIVLKEGSFVQKIILITTNPMVVEVIGVAVIMLLNNYHSNKNIENHELRYHKDIVGPISVEGDHIQVNGGNNTFFLNYKEKDGYLSNLEPGQKNDGVKRERLVGRFRRVDLDRSENKFGFTPIFGKQVPATIVGISDPVSILPDIMDKDLKVDANVTYKEGKIVSVEVLKYELVNRPLDLDDASA